MTKEELENEIFSMFRKHDTKTELEIISNCVKKTCADNNIDYNEEIETFKKQITDYSKEYNVSLVDACNSICKDYEMLTILTKTGLYELIKNNNDEQ